MNPTEILIEQIRSGKAPLQIRRFAAQGLLPMPQDDQIPLQVILANDPEVEIATSAQATLKAVPETVWIRLVERKNPDLQIVHYCLDQPDFPFSIKEKILLNHSVPDETISHAAKNEKGQSLDLIIQNHVRLLRSASILHALEQNPFVSIDQKRRIEEFKTEFVFKKPIAPMRSAIDDIVSLPLDDILMQIPTLDPEAQRLILEADENPGEAITEEQIQRTLQNLFSSEELKEIPEEVLTTYQRILQMKQGEKLRAALLGSKDERSILIRDTSRLVASMVLRNPRLTDAELEGYTQMRNLDSELLRRIGQSREFTKRYIIVHNLVKNPKTPSPVSLNLLKLLRESDLRNIAKDRNIPDLIRRQAKHIFDRKEAHR